jgi:hypothetical protein
VAQEFFSCINLNKFSVLPSGQIRPQNWLHNLPPNFAPCHLGFASGTNRHGAEQCHASELGFERFSGVSSMCPQEKCIPGKKLIWISLKKNLNLNS